MDIVSIRNSAVMALAKIAAAFTALTAGGTGDNTAVTGITVDRVPGGVPFFSARILIAYSAVLAATKTLTLKSVKVEHSDDGSTWADYLTFTDPGVVATGQSGGSTEKGVLELAVDLTSAKKYVRVDYTPDLSASGTDTATVVTILDLAGADRLPQ